MPLTFGTKVSRILCVVLEAGRTAAEKVKGTAEELGMSVQIVTLPEGTDPGGLVKDQVNRISKRLYG